MFKSNFFSILWSWLVGFCQQYKVRLAVFFLFSLSLFFWFRLYRITTSIQFYNDIGRDFWELLNWYQTGKPPLLGPQTSALPFNQSAIYFYLLFPGYVLSGQSAYSTIYTGLFVYVLSFLIGWRWLKNNKDKWILGLIFLFTTVHPQVVIQNRYVWNPTFVLPSLVAAVFIWLSLIDRWSSKKLLAWSFFSALATAFSYSAAPLVLSMLALTPWLKIISWKKFFKYQIPFFILSLVVVNLPTIVFEIRHQFLLTKMLLFQPKTEHLGTELTTKISALANYVFSTSSWLAVVVLVFLLVLAIRAYCQYRSNRQYNFAKKVFVILALTVISLTLTFLAPVPIHPHYVFGALTVLLFLVALLPKKVGVIILIIASVYWLQPKFTDQYFEPVGRSPSDLLACYTDFCDKYQQPIYVSVQSSLHPYHNGPEHRYFMKFSGCDVKEIEKFEPAELMAVVLEEGDYQHGSTSYYELSLFGESVELERYTCLPDVLEVVVLSK